MNARNYPLNNLFTIDEFNFVDHIDSNMKTFESILQKETIYKNSINKLINNLKNLTITSDSSLNKSGELSTLLSTSSEILELANKNIDTINHVLEISDGINKQIVDLLVKIESEGENATEAKFYDEISKIKNEINNSDYSLNNFKEEILHNHEQIENFVHRDDVQKFLSFFFINIDEVNKLNSVFDRVIVSDKSDVFEPIEESNDTLLFLEKDNKVYLPYSEKEVMAYLDQYPNQYKSFKDVVEKEFIFSADFYMKHPVVARFRETYSLIRDRESKSIFEAFKYAMEVMFRRDLNPAIIAACKSQEQLEDYLECLDKGNLDDFTAFKIKFEVTPLKV